METVSGLVNRYIVFFWGTRQSLNRFEDRVIIKMFENMIDVALYAVVGLFLGILISIFYWRRQVGAREDYIEELETSMEGKDSDIKGFTNRLKEMETEVEGLGDQLSQRDEAIRDQAAQIESKDGDINQLKADLSSIEKQNQDSIARAEDAEARAGELENSVEEKEREIAALKARMRAMQDDFSIIAGIGPRVSEILRSARINTFAKLAVADEGRIRDILEAENPSLLRLTDPSTWSEQASLAAEEDWEALSALQESLKGG